MIPLPLRVALAEAARCEWDAWVNETSLLAGWHDIGKTTCLFQNQAPDDCPDWLRGHEDMHRVSTPGAPVHAADSKRIVWDYLSGLLEPEARLRAANVVGAHHGCTPTRPPPPRMPACMQIDKQNAAYVVDIGQARADLLHVLIAVNGGSIIDERSGLMASTVQAGVVVLADWMVSCTPFIHEQRKRHKRHCVSRCASNGVVQQRAGNSRRSALEDRPDPRFPVCPIARRPAAVNKFGGHRSAVAPGGAPHARRLRDHIHLRADRRRENRSGASRRTHIQPCAR